MGVLLSKLNKIRGCEGMRKKIAGILVCMLLFPSVFSVTARAHTLFPNRWELKLSREIVSLETAPNGEVHVSLLTSDPFVTITLTPSNPTVKIPPSGGSFDYSIVVTNNEATPLTFHVWTMVTLPNGNPHGPVLGVEVSLPAGWSANGDVAMDVPDFAPQGNYTYSGYVGIYPDEVWDSDSFIFEKLSSGGWYAQNSGTSAYLLSVFFADAYSGWAVGSVRTILHTENGGNNWYPQSSEIFATFSSVFFADAHTGWIVGSLGVIIHTKDGGSSWHTQHSGSSYDLWSVYFIDDKTGWAVGGREPSFLPSLRIILGTTDGGNNWNVQMYESYKWPLRSVYFADADTGWAVGEAGTILHTTDGGTNWYPQTSGTSQWLKSVYFVDGKTGWTVGGEGVVLHTTNAGDNWLTQASGTTNALSGVYFADDETGWAVGLYGTVLHTTNGGAS